MKPSKRRESSTAVETSSSDATIAENVDTVELAAAVRAKPGVGGKAAANDADEADADVPDDAEMDSDDDSEADGETNSDESDDASVDAAPRNPRPNARPVTPRKQIQDQLEALKRKEAELRRALAIADHPDLTEPLRIVEGRAYAVARVESKMAQGLSKAEEKRRDTLQKKLSGLVTKRDELNTQIEGLEAELRSLIDEREQGFAEERREAMKQLVMALGAHEAAFREADLDLENLMPEIVEWRSELEATAEAMAAAGSSDEDSDDSADAQ